MASPPNIQQLSLHPVQQQAGQGENASQSAPSVSTATSPTTLILSSPEGIDCYGNERQVLMKQTKFFNNEALSDIILTVGGNKFYAHKFILVQCSDVFERMLSEEWSNNEKKEVELIEDSECVAVFPRFLKFLYSCHIKLNIDNTLPVLILADKYNVTSLRQVCTNFACSFIIPKLQLKDVFHQWFQYGTKCYHKQLITSCVNVLAQKMDEVIGSVEWEQEWITLDRDQLVEFLRSSDLVVKDEYELWNAAVKWLISTQHQTRLDDLEVNLQEVVKFIRFPMMAPQQLCEIERSEIVQKHPDIFQKPFLLAYKYHALTLTGRAHEKCFISSPCLLRNYSDLRWDKRFVIHYPSCQKYNEMSERFSTRASSLPVQVWDWELKVFPKGFSSNADDFRCILYSNLILDQPRPIEYLLSIVGKDEIIHSVYGRKSFSKTRYTADTEMDKKVSVGELAQPNSPYLVDEKLILQISLKPVD